ncbi:hypothetical protein KCU91_g18239, partial [Aureobasidium melanogenum]
MVKGKESSDAGLSQHLEHKAPRSTDNSSTMSTSAKPKSSTSEAAKTQKKRRTIKRCSESDEEGIEDLTSEPVKPKTISSEVTKPKTSTTRQQITPESIDSDHQDDEESEEDDEDEEDDESSDDEQTNTKTPIKTSVKAPIKASPLATKKQTSSKKQAPKRPIDSYDDDEVIEVASKLKKSKTQPAAPSSSKKQTAVSSKRKSNNDSDDDITELPSKTTKTKPKANPKQPVKSSSSTLTKKQTFKASKEPPAETDSEEEDSSDEEAPNVVVTERKGDLFAAPNNTLLLHACNCVGSWGAGIALAFKKRYPDHFATYEAHCKSKTPNSLLSTCLLIPPQPTGPQHWIGCLFTSRKYGRGKDSKDDIMDSTDSALQDMLEQLGDMENKPLQIWMCKINSGSFKVPWSQTKALVEALTFKDGLHIQVVDKK